MKLFIFAFAFLCLASPSFATLHYIDGAVGSSGNGLSWATAWKDFSNITGLAAGDTVYVSGGTTSQAYTLSNWTPTGGTSGNPITYAVGQDAGHTGVVTITSTTWLNGTFSNVTIDGNVGGAQHWSVTPSDYFWLGSSGTNARVTLRYIIAPNMGAGIYWSSADGTAIEISHCSLTKDNDSGNIRDFIFYGVNGTGAGQISVHDNYIQYPLASNRTIGDDMWIFPGNIEFYNNTVKGQVRSTYSWTQHSDGFQTNSSSNIHVYNNTFINPGESVFYEDSQTAATVSSILIYNNLIMRTVACDSGQAQRLFDMNPEGGGLNNTVYVDIVIANNTIVDDSGTCSFGTRFLGARSYTRVYAVNNLGAPAGSDVAADAGVTVSNNVDSGSVQFVSYAQFAGTSNNLHLTSSDTVAKNQGISMSSYFTTDRDGVTRPQGSAWDIGAYEFTAGASGGSSITGAGVISGAITLK